MCHNLTLFLITRWICKLTEKTKKQDAVSNDTASFYLISVFVLKLVYHKGIIIHFVGYRLLRAKLNNKGSIDHLHTTLGGIYWKCQNTGICFEFHMHIVRAEVNRVLEHIGKVCFV